MNYGILFTFLAILGASKSKKREFDAVSIVEQLEYLGSDGKRKHDVGVALLDDLKVPANEFMVERLVKSNSNLLEPLLVHSLQTFPGFMPSSVMLTMLKGKLSRKTFDALERRVYKPQGSLTLYILYKRYFEDGLSESSLDEINKKCVKVQSVADEYIQIPDIKKILEGFQWKKKIKGNMEAYTHVLDELYPKWLHELIAHDENKLISDVFSNVLDELRDRETETGLKNYIRHKCRTTSPRYLGRDSPRKLFSKQFLLMCSLAKLPHKHIQIVARHCTVPLSKEVFANFLRDMDQM